MSRHIEKIDCYQDGKVVMRGSLLGLFEGAVELLSRNDTSATSSEPPSDGYASVRPRRRGRLRIDDLSANGDLGLDSVNTALAPDHFAGLADEFMWEEALLIPQSMSWAQEHAIEVAERRLAGLKNAKLCEEFSKTPPTIRNALRHAAEVDERFRNLPRKMERARWHEDRALEVAAKKAEGLDTNELAAHFGKSDTTLRKALDHAAKLDRESD